MYGCLRGLLSKATQSVVYRKLFRKDWEGLFWRLMAGGCTKICSAASGLLCKYNM